MSRGPTQPAVGDLEAEGHDTRRAVEAARRARARVETGISGAWCEPRMQPATVCGNANGSSTSPTAGSPDWQRTISTGSSLPT